MEGTKKPLINSPSASTQNNGLMSPLALEQQGHAQKSSKDMMQSTGSIDETDRLDRSDRSMYNITGTSAQTRKKQTKDIKSPNDKGKEATPIINMKYKIYKPREPDQCPLFCAFYAEFDNKVGPKICYQSPKYFMDQDISISINEIHEILSKSFSKTKDETDPNTEISPVQPSSSQSIFDSTCEYIISELTGQLISISTHNFHIIAKPIIIQDARYERNSFLFSVGFVIRRQIDPAPFRPLLTTLASTLQSMEYESHFLSNPTTKPVLQSLLDVLVPSLNSPSSKCHILLDKTNSLHLQYFPAPKAHASTIKDYVVPVLLRPESQLYTLGWDLTINWIVPHINGIKYAKYIAKSSQVDEEMVRACLRVLRHHNVLACVDIFRYSNIYESTPKAQLALCGKLQNLMEGAYEFIVKVPQKRSSSPSPSSMMLIPPKGAEGPLSYPPFQSLDANENPSSSYVSSPKSHRQNISQNGSKDSFSSPVSPQQMTQKISSSMHSHSMMPTLSKQDKESMLIALSILYTSCNRGQTLGEIIMEKLKAIKQSVTDKTSKLRPKITTSSLGSHESFDSNSNVIHKIDWKETFSMLDFRRFITFGVIHGLIHRVHEFPYILDNGTQSYDINSNDHPSSMMESNDIKKKKRDNQSNVSLRSDSAAKTSHSMLSLAKNIALAMDGTRCDDELACMFEREMKELKQIVKKYSNKEILSVYSTVDH